MKSWVVSLSINVAVITVPSSVIRIFILSVLSGDVSVRLGHRASSVDDQRVADHVARARAAEPKHGRCDLFRPADTAERYLLHHILVGLLVPTDHIPSNLRVDGACA